MNKISYVMDNIDPVPSLGFVNVIKMLRQHDMLMDLEKTASVAAKVTDRETEIIEAFYKLSAAAPAPGFFKKMFGAGSAIFSPEAAANLGREKALEGRALTKATKKFDTIGKRSSAAWDATKSAVSDHPVAASLTGAGLVAGGVGLATRPSRASENQQVVIKSAETLCEAGWALAKTANPRVDFNRISNTLSKIASVGAVNAKLRQSLDSSILSKQAKLEARELGIENNTHLISLLKELIG